MRTSKARLHQLGCWRGWLFRNHSRGAWNFEVKSWGHQMGGPIFGGESNLIQIYGNFGRNFPEKITICMCLGWSFIMTPVFLVGIWKTNDFQVRIFSFQTFIFRWSMRKSVLEPESQPFSSGNVSIGCWLPNGSGSMGKGWQITISIHLKLVV